MSHSDQGFEGNGWFHVIDDAIEMLGGCVPGDGSKDGDRVWERVSET